MHRRTERVAEPAKDWEGRPRERRGSRGSQSASRCEADLAAQDPLQEFGLLHSRPIKRDPTRPSRHRCGVKNRRLEPIYHLLQPELGPKLTAYPSR